MDYYKTSNNNFDRNGDIKLQPSSAIFRMELNGDNSIEVEHPYDSEGRWKQIEVLGVIKTEVCYTPHKQLYRIYDIEKDMDCLKIKARHIFFDLSNKTILDNRANNVDGQKALDIILQDTNFKGKSNITKKAYCYFVDMSVLSAIKGDKDNTFLSRFGGEIYLDNFNIIINDRIGKVAGTIKYSRNMQDISLSENTDEVVTRAIPKAYNGYKIPGNYVDSPLIDKYPLIFENFVDLSDLKLKDDASDDDDPANVFDTKDELYIAMRNEVKKLYQNGLDKPVLEGDVDIAILQDLEEFKDYTNLVGVGAGDTLKANHEELNIELTTRCLSLEWNILTKKYNDMSFGNNVYKNTNYFDKQDITTDKVNRILNKNGSVNGAVVQGAINGYDAKLKAMRLTAEEQQTKAILFEDRVPGSKTWGALAIGTAGFMIASKLDDNGEWIWSTFGTGEGFTADYINTGVLRNLDNSFAIDLNSKGSANFFNNNQKALEIKNNSLNLFNWNGNADKVGTVTSICHNDSDGNPIATMPMIGLINEKNSAVSIGYRDKDKNNIMHSYINFDYYNILKDSDKAPIKVKEDIEFRGSSIFNANYKADNAIPFFIDGVNVSNFNKDQIYFNIPIAANKDIEMRDHYLHNAKIKGDKVICFYIGDKIVGKFESDKLTLNVPIYNKNGTLALDPAAPQGETIVVDDSDALRQKVVNSARKLIGRMYLFGGNVAPLGNDSSTDCSGLMQWSYNDNNIHISRTTYTQIKEGVEVSKDNLKPADLIFSNFSSPGVPEHVFMYAGTKNGQMYCVEAAHTGTAIRERVFIWQDGMRARRIIKDNPHTVTPGGTTTGGGTGPNGTAGARASANIIYYVKGIEGYSDHVYLDSVSCPTLGMGLTGAELKEAEGSMINGKLSEKDATFYLQKFFNRDYYSKVLAILKKNNCKNIKQRHVDAFSSFAYNEGVGAFEGSTLLKKYIAGERGEAIHQEFLKWTLAGTQHLEGLRRRREEEWKIFSNSGAVPGYDGRPYIEIIGTSKTVETNGGYGASPY